MSAKITLLHQKTAVDPYAIKQLKHASALPGMETCIGMPDLHPGSGSYPVGAAFVSTTVYPELVGQDIGCGMTLYEMDCPKDISSRQIEKLCKHLKDVSFSRASSNTPKITTDQATMKILEKHQNCFGTIGGGNHFAELQIVEREEEEGTLSKQKLHLLVHSGSRSLGEDVLKMYRDKLKQDPEHAISFYLNLHNLAVEWARQSREQIALKVSAACNVPLKRKILDICHNSVMPVTGSENLFVHRKGAAPTDAGLVAIPGSRGAFAFIVRPTNDAALQAGAGWSIAHGAGRAVSRKDMQRSLENRYKSNLKCEQALSTTSLGGRVVCDNVKTLLQEAPEAYKSIENVIEDLSDLIVVVAVMRPIVTCK